MTSTTAMHETTVPAPPPPRRRAGWWWATLAVFVAALLATVPTIPDFGMTFDEPAYRFCQEMSGQWWERLATARTTAELRDVMAADSLLYYWPYARFGINFHPPLAGQLNLLTWKLFGGILSDSTARRLAQPIQLSACAAVLFLFLGRRYGALTGLAAAASLLLMPRVYAQAHLVETDLPGMLIWLLAAVAFWKGLYEPHGRVWRIALGVLAGLAFVEKMAAVVVFVPLVAWLIASRLPRAMLHLRDDRGAWTDAALTLTTMMAPLALAYAEIRHLAAKLPPPQNANLFYNDPPSALPGAILLVPLGIWLIRSALRRWRPTSPTWGVERPALEILQALLAFGPAVSWLGNPAWWRHSMVRLAHYYQLTTARRGSLPDIQNLYFGRVYNFTMPWPSGWVIIGITTPTVILAAAVVGAVWGLWRATRDDRLPLFALVLFAVMPLTRLSGVPAHDGVRLLMPCFPFLAMLSAWGLARAGAFARWTVRQAPNPVQTWTAPVVVTLLLAPAAWASYAIHPYGLSYYNQLIGGPAGAWNAGMELTYWYDAFTPQVIADLNRRLPPDAPITYAHEQSNPAMIVQDLQSTGVLRGDLHPWDPGTERTFPYMWLLTHDSKASSFTRLLFAMRPWYASYPSQLDGRRALSVLDPAAVSRAWVLQFLAHGSAAADATSPIVPEWVRQHAPALSRLWVAPVERPQADMDTILWARQDPASLRQAAQAIVAWARRPGTDLMTPAPFPEGSDAMRLLKRLRRDDRKNAPFSEFLLRIRPEALTEAIEILISRGDAVRNVLEFIPYRDPAAVGGYLDQDVAQAEEDGR
jgi:hypothetical protein